MILDVSARGIFVRASTGTAPKEAGTEVPAVVKRNGHFILQLAQVAIPMVLSGDILRQIHGLRSAFDIGPEPRPQSSPTQRRRPTEG